ncbi:chalcone isomerase family protein [Agaribacter flavus]|uniref:Chalcone isomerase family protein n=1 Tax=Agaribacter flavus TaxID=1902781 RepID=A0ABV7FLM3_9ALTE
MRYLCIVLILLCSSLAEAKSYIKYIDDPKTVGKTRLEVLFWDIYDAELVAPKGQWSKDKPFALSLTYLRAFDGKEIASRSIDEIRDLGMEDERKLAKWFEQMQILFPDVKEGNTITGIVDDRAYSIFYFDEQRLGVVEDPEFSQWFFDIWLSEKSSEPKMRKRLLGL